MTRVKEWPNVCLFKSSGPITKFGDYSMQQVGLTLRLEEAGPAGQLFKLYVPVAAYRDAAELAGYLNAGDAVMVAGKLQWTSWTAKDSSKKSTLAVLARLVTVLGPTPALAERRN